MNTIRRIDSLTDVIKELEAVAHSSCNSTRKELKDIVEELIYIRLRLAMGSER